MLTNLRQGRDLIATFLHQIVHYIYTQFNIYRKNQLHTHSTNTQRNVAIKLHNSVNYSQSIKTVIGNFVKLNRMQTDENTDNKMSHR